MTALAFFAEAIVLERDQGHDGKAVIELGHVNVGWLEAGHRKSGLCGNRCRRAGQYWPLHHLPGGLTLAESENGYRPAHLQLARPLGRHHHHGRTAVRDQAAVVAGQGRDDQARLAVLLQRQGFAQLGIRVGRAMLAASGDDGAELVARGAELGHVPLRDHGVARGCAEPAEHVVVTPGFFIGMTRAGGGVIGQADQRHLALPGLDGHRGVADHADVAGPAVVVHAANARHQAHGLGQLLRVHHFELGGRGLDEQSIDHGFVDARIGQGLARRLDIQRDGAAALELAEGGVPDTGDDGFASHQMTSSSTSCCNC